MNTFVRWMVTATFGMTLAFAAPQQNNGALPDAKGALAGVAVGSLGRVLLPGNISHYTIDIRVGPDQFDVIRLHRVVKELTPGQPVRTVNGVFLLPGAPNYFEAVFMTPLISQAAPSDHSIAVYLAKNDIDVWGMDYRWAMIPAETTDLSFMKDWGIAKDRQDAQIALSVARFFRLFSGQSSGPLHLLGFSWGGMIGYSIASEETQQPDSLRSLKGLIALDIGVKLEKEADREINNCSWIESDQAALDSGVYNADSGSFLKQLGGLALSAPNDPSDNIPGMTNYQAALFAGTSNELSGGQSWHFVGGYLDENGVPSDLRYSKARVWLDLLQNIPIHFPTRAGADSDLWMCGKTNVTFTEHLGLIAIPILHVGAAGGFGKAGFYSATFTKSKDVKTLLVQRQPDDKRQEDFGHADTILANDAETAVWKPILDWIVAHR
jgi:pimeloyl-ACP methyl ester carboxylesterase